ncbi:MAG: ribonuclease III [Patescibacteria group bacterium]
MEIDVKKIEELLEVKFKDKELVKTAFTHRSFLNEHPDYKNPSNERLEFLGDAILQFLSSEFLYHNYPKAPEGNLTNFRAALVNTTSLAEESRRLGFGEFLFLSHGEEASGGRNREYILANTFEAVIGLIYLENDVETVRVYLTKQLFYKVKHIVENNKYKDFKSAVQELSQAKMNQTPLYKVVDQWGPDHNKTFKVGIYVGEKLFGEGEGSSKQRAEQMAAKNALDNLIQLK